MALSVVKVSPSDMRQLITLRVKLPKMLPARRWLSVRLIRVAAWIACAGVEIEVDGNG